jgi:hypothetical protein
MVRMRMSGSMLALLAGLLVSACASTGDGALADEPRAKPVITIEEEPEWMSLAAEADQGRIARIDEAWQAALEEARRRGFSAALEGEGELLVPGAALGAPSPPPGSYRCRAIKIGTQSGSGQAFTAYKPFFCYVEAEGSRLNITKQTGSQRPSGWLYKDHEEDRLIFLGSLAMGEEKEPLPYGENEKRDMAGVVERVAPYRYRLVVPWPKAESKLDVIELVPAPPQ